MKPILFVDFDGTLCHDRFWRSADSQIRDRVQKYLFSERKELVGDWMRGKYSSEDIHRILESELGLEYAPLWDIFVSDCNTMNVDPAILNAIDSLREKYHTVLMTGNMDCFNRFTIPALGLEKHFDRIVNSYDRKKLKDDEGGKEFLDIAADFGAGISSCILIDDSEKCCRVFGELGGKSCCVSKETDLAYFLRRL